MLNYDLVQQRSLSEDAVRDLEVLHDIMDCLVLSYSEDEYNLTKTQRKLLKSTIEGIEYMMQEKWKFDRDRRHHTHWKRFDGLYKKRYQGTHKSTTTWSYPKTRT